ncbi:MAG TPA: stage III sporulation protein AB [Candidatus Onthovicinus excrementipullorum]|nr:stage III sporulation protein AB [Candidatus Onthovicinus excrementipullorum]
MKILGMILVMVCCMAAGRFYSGSLIRRIRALERTLLLIGQFEMHLEFSRAPAAEIVMALREHPEFSGLKYLRTCAEEIAAGVDFPGAWRTAVSGCAADALNAGDAELLLSFGNGLGQTDLPGQEKLCAVHRRMIEERLESARQQYASKGKLGTALGTAAGAVAVLFFL